ncbi:hypothetical protein [Schlesneria paludicola]|uniref:hypothetical protein n=1 Tax=Schlesneria paludicola TaxID=360056 RepID=UPI0012F88DD6|nr:hypothetical protein [Schlesneria paludicola]
MMLSTRCGGTHLLITIMVAGFCRVAGASDEIPEAISNAYQANRTSITFGSFRFRYDVGQAPHIEAGEKGEWSKKATASGSYAFNESDAVYECVFSVTDMLADRVMVDGGSWSSQLVSKRRLTNGSLVLWDNLFPGPDDTTYSHTCQIDAGSEIFYKDLMFPLALGSPRKAHQDVFDHAPMPPVEIKEVERESQRLIYMRFEGERSLFEYWIDVAKGAIPVEIRKTLGSEEPKVRLTIFNKDIRMVSHDGWMPFRTLTFIEPSFVRELVVEEADCRTAPDAKAFSLEFTEARAMIDVPRKVRHEPRKVWSLIEAASDSEAQPIEFSEPTMRQPDVKESPIVSPFSLLIALNVCGVALLALFFYARHRLARRGLRKRL